MNSDIPEKLGIIAGKGNYPLLLAASARQQGVRFIFALAFHGETERSIEKLADRVVWVRLGQLGAAYTALEASGIGHFVMAGQITPTSLFHMRMDGELLALLGRLRERNAHSIFGALTEELGKRGIEMLPASCFMEAHMAEPGVLTVHAPTPAQKADIELGLTVAKTTSGLEIGQTVALKDGTILAVEAFEGTDATILRAGDLGGPGVVVVKVSKRGHDVRFDLPVIGERTLKSLRKAKAAVLAVEARRTILLDRLAVLAQAERQGLCIVAIETTENLT